VAKKYCHFLLPEEKKRKKNRLDCKPSHVLLFFDEEKKAIREKINTEKHLYLFFPFCILLHLGKGPDPEKDLNEMGYGFFSRYFT